MKKKIFTAPVFIQYHAAVQPHVTIPTLAKCPLGPQTACMDQHWAWEQQAKQTTQVVLIFIVKFDSLYSFVFLVKNQVMGNMISFPKPSHIIYMCV